MSSAGHNLFSDFTNQYSLSKTLRFELKPEGKTQQMLEEAQVFIKDETIQKKYEKTKPYFDRLHREFVNEALQNAVLSGLDGYLEIFKEWKLERNSKVKKENGKKLQIKEKSLREEVVKFFDAQGEKWAKEYAGLKNKNIEILFEEAVFESVLKERYQNDSIQKNGKILPVEVLDESTGKIISIFSSWKGFSGYFTKFFATRRNFYKDDGTATALATRIIDQNLKRFCDNILIFEDAKEKKVDFSEVENNFGKSLSEIFSLELYNSCLLQGGIDFYNKILGGETKTSGEKLKGLNECINLRKQQTGEKLSFFKALDKQILSEKEAFLDGIQTDEEFLKVLKRFQAVVEEKTKNLKALFVDFVSYQEKYSLEQTYLSKEAFNTISHKWTNETEAFESNLFDVLKKAKIVSSSAKKKDGGYSFPDFIALSFLKESLEKVSIERFWKEKYYKNENDSLKGFLELTSKENIWKQFLGIFSFEFSSLFEREIIIQETGEKKIIGYDSFQKSFDALLRDFKCDQNAKIVIKEFADNVLTIYQMAKYFALEKKRKWIGDDYETGEFYDNPDFGYKKCFYDKAYEEIVQVYNNLRNYLTKKPYSEAKWKLNFEKPTLANGWPDSPDGNTQYCSFIFRNKEKYFLGVTDFPTIFDKSKFPEAYKDDQGGFEKMVYKQVDAKTLYGSVYAGIFGTKYSDDQGILNDQDILQRMKQVLETRVQFFPEFSKFIRKINNNQYTTAKELAREISEGAFYNISFIPISKQYLERGIYSILKNKLGELKEKKLYLFQIKNKDWNEGVIGMKNLHTLYFESLFSAENIADNFPVKLNGQAEIFYRPRTEESKLGYREDKDGSIRTFIDKRDNDKRKNVVKNRRYNEDKIFFHVPLTLNRTKPAVSARQFNDELNNFLANNPEINIIGVDRGEKHLAYYSVITQKGEILERGSLNSVKGGNNQEINYAEKLEVKSKNREQARKDWQAVEGIKDLKKGYISQVVRKLADLAIEHNAIIVFEDLNMRFKQIRGGIEKSIYQQLEKALIEKLNFLVNKGEKDPKKAGHLLRAYQLTAPFETFKDMGKQTGIIFYTQAAYTSRIDPVTGWRPHLYLKYSSAEKAKIDILQFSKIEFVNNRFEFTYDIKNFQNAKEYPKNTVWTICSSVERFRWNKKLNNNRGGYTHYINLTDGKTDNKNSKSTKPDNIKELFEKYGIDIKGNIKGQIQSLNVKGNEKFFEHFIFFINLICQIRNTQKEKDGDENDFILLPVEPFFDSRKVKSGDSLPQNGDDNGAYNIARKGIIVLEKISDFKNRNGNCDKMEWGDLNISHAEWDNFAQQQKWNPTSK